MADNWSKAELAVSVETYLWMLGEEQAGRPYVKSHAMREAQTKLPNRKLSDFRMQNISSVLKNLGQSWIDGYKPAGNVGVNVSNLIEELLDELGYWESDLNEETFQANTSWVYSQDGSGMWSITEEGVHEAIEECKTVGSDSFLSQYGFGKSTKYKLKFEGKLFHPKAIVGVAHKWSQPDSEPLTHEQFSSGVDHGNACWCLSDLGFEIIEIETDIKTGDESGTEDVLYEGAVKKVEVNNYERNTDARKLCLEEYGYLCAVCDFDFEDFYGEIGKEYIHVHHLKEISSVGEEYVIDPIEDLRPLCPNCHAMIHKSKPAFTIEELRQLIKENT